VVFGVGFGLNILNGIGKMDYNNMFGLTRGKYFGEPPLYVDKSQAPGMTDLLKPTVAGWLRAAPLVLINTPNFIWMCVALLTYKFFPYDLSPDSIAAAGPLTYAFFAERLPLWLPLIFGYFAFCHISIYGFNLSTRPFIADRVYNVDKVVHNAFWTTSGIVIWTAYENVFCYLWASGRLSYISDIQSFGTLWGFAAFLGALMSVPLWRSFHFYFAHRFLHYEALYQQVHSLHHRNTDIEPFSGLCMHPVEHLYYFACVAPSLVFYCSPFAFLWNGVHLLMSPAASHSGYEDNFQSDIFHYLHHRYFECNYAGSDAAFMDIAFGTFKGSFKVNDADKDGPKPRDDAKSSLRLVPTCEFVTYLGLSAACVGLWASQHGVALTQGEALALALLVGFGPTVLATVISSLFRASSGVKRVEMNFLGNLLHLVMGTVFCGVPVSYACYLALNV
jgi:sterol desaturase/sphingolipid hydroxylase (fatty acid hydroxylase superfamily)